MNDFERNALSTKKTMFSRISRKFRSLRLMLSASEFRDSSPKISKQVFFLNFYTGLSSKSNKRLLLCSILRRTNPDHMIGETIISYQLKKR